MALAANREGMERCRYLPCDYYKPSDLLFDAVSEGRVLILAPTSYDPDKRFLSREDCITLNKIAEDLCIR